MKATALEYRLRFLIHAAMITLGFWAPWDRWLHLDTVRTWQFCAAWLTRSAHMSFSASTVLVLAAGIVFALAAAMLRTWGSAYMGPSVVIAGAMKGDRVIASGPYRRMRNPLYLGIMLHVVALGLLMPPSGAVLTLVLIVLFELRLILGEEAFLSERLGEAYRAYRAQVPRLVPSLTPRVADAGVRPAWGMAFASEIYMWGVAVSFAVLGWRYNSMLMLQGVLVSLGISLVVRALVVKR